MLRYWLLGALLLYAQTPAQQTPLPISRIGVDIVELDVTVLDNDRLTVKGLTADVAPAGRPDAREPR